MKRTPDAVARATYGLRDMIEAIATAVGVAPHDVDDVVQALATISAHAAERESAVWSSPDAFRSWLRIVAIHVASSHRSKVRREAWLHAELREDVRTVPSVEERYAAIETLALLRASTTPERWRAAASFARGVPIEEVARRAGLTVAGAYNRIRLARGDMRITLARSKH